MLYSSDKSKTLVCFAHDIFNVISPGQIFTQCYTQVLERATILHKIGAKFVPLPPKSRMGKWRVLAFARLHPWFGANGGLLFHFILSTIVWEPRLALVTALCIAIMTWNLHSNSSKLNAFKANLVIYQWTHTKQKNCAYLIYIKYIKNSRIISLYEVQDALLTTREFCWVEDEKKKTCLCPIHCNYCNTFKGRTLRNIYRKCIGW